LIERRRSRRRSTPNTTQTARIEEVTVVATTATQILTAADRCDRCGARAYLQVRLPGGGELLFCAHHGRALAPALRAAEADIHDESDKLTETPAIAPDGEH
jgi:hypothetical protein